MSKLMLLPPHEDPVVATVTDKNKLQKQAFLSEADNGDKILIYSTAKKVIIYRPSINKIVDVGPVSIAAPTNVGAK